MSEIWLNFPLFASLSAALWILGMVLHYGVRQNYATITANTSIALGTLILVAFITMLWIKLERPPLRTLGETRLWYSIFLPTIGLITYYNWKYKWLLGYSVVLAIVFLVINYMHPENYSKTLMPALQSPWFVPHVVVYIFAYALLGISCLISFYGLYQLYYTLYDEKTLKAADNMVYVGFAFLTFGLIFGALWAKEAWGHYWTWDPKETWAFLTWFAYLSYMHYRYYQPNKTKTHLWILGVSFLVLLVCWFGINYLPSAQNSVHVYSN